MTTPSRAALFPTCLVVVAAVLVGVVAACQSTSAKKRTPSAKTAAGLTTTDAERPAAARAPLAGAPRDTRRTAIPTRPVWQTAAVNSLVFDDEPYGDVLKTLAGVTGAPIIVTPPAREILVAEDLRLDLTLTAPIRLTDLLGLMFGRSDSLGWTVRHGVLMVTTKADAAGKLELLTYDVRDLIFPRTEFLPPQIVGLPTGEEAGDAPRTGSEGDETVPAIEPDILIDNIKMVTGEENWDGADGATIEFLGSGYLLVKASRAMHRKVSQFLGGR